MKRWNIFLLALPAIVALAFLMGGCYTQVGSTREDKFQEFEEQDQAYQDTVSQQEYDDARQRFYYGAYSAYPWIGFGFGYYDPWYWNYGGYYYSPYWYNPMWGWCGTYYPAYYATPYWGYPYDSYYSHGAYTYRTGDDVVVRPGGPYGATRTFGSTRTPVGGTRGGSEVLPSATRSGSGMGKQSTAAPLIPRASTRRAEARPAGTSTSGSKPATRSGGTREGTRPSGGDNRGGNRRYEAAPYTPPAPSSPGHSDGGGSGRSGGSVAPASAPSSPPPSGSGGGGHAPSNTGQRGNERR